MRYFGFFIVIFISNNRQIKANTISCDAHALQWGDVQASLSQERIFWTTQYQNFYEEDDFHYGSVKKHRLIRTDFKYNNEKVKSYDCGVTSEKSIFCYVYSYTLDVTRAVFQYDPKYTAVVILFNDHDDSDFKEPNIIPNLPTTKRTFAIVYNDDRGSFRIFQSCDRKLTWVQIADDVLMKYHPNQRSINYSTKSLNKLNNNIRQKLDELGITKTYTTDIVQEFGTNILYNHFDYINAATVMIPEGL